MAETVVDAGVELEKRERERARAEDAAPDVEGARGKALLAGARRQWPVGARTFFVVTGLVAVGLVSVLLLKARSARKEAEARERESPAKTMFRLKFFSAVSVTLTSTQPVTNGEALSIHASLDTK